MCSTDVYCSNKPAAVAPKETITHHFFVSGIGQKKTVRCSQNLYTENVVKTETQQTFVNGLLGFITLGIYTRWKRVLLTHRRSSQMKWQLYLHCSLIYFWVPSSCFCIVISSLSEGEIILSMVSASQGEAALSTPRRWWLHALTDRLLDVQPTTTSGNIITQSIIFSFSIS